MTQRFGISQHRVAAVLEAHGVSRRPVGRRPGASAKRRASLINLIGTLIHSLSRIG
jgi:hypothetical protein